MTLAELIPLAFTAALSLLVLAVGLDARVQDFLFLWRRPGKLAAAFVAIALVPPLAALAAVTVLPLGAFAKAGVMLMAIAPVPPLVPGKDLKLGGEKPYVYSLYLSFALLSIVLVPLGVWLLDTMFARDVTVTPAQVAVSMAGSVLAPLALGVVLHAISPHVASKVSVWVYRASMVLLVVACIPIFIHAWPVMMSLIGDGTLVAVLFVSATALVVGHVLGGPERAERVALAAAAATRHPGLALMVVHAAGAKPQVSAAILLYLLTSMVAVTIYQLILKAGARRASSVA